MEHNERKAARLSALFYTVISLSVALAFLVIANNMGKYTSAAIYGGAAWVFLLSMIITMPTVTPWLKKMLKG